MSASVLATGRAFSSQSAVEISNRPAAGQASRARPRIQPKSPRASIQISEFTSCMHSVSWIHARAGGWEAAHAMVWSRLPGRGGPPNSFEKSAVRKLKCTRRLRSMASGCARARGSAFSPGLFAACSRSRAKQPRRLRLLPDHKNPGLAVENSLF